MRDCTLTSYSLGIVRFVNLDLVAIQLVNKSNQLVGLQCAH